MIGRIARFVRTRVSRRLFVLFVLSAFLPLAAIAVLSLTQVREMLLQQGEQRLAGMAKNYGMSLLERLQVAADVAASDASLPAGAAAADPMAARMFRGLVRVSPGEATALTGAPPLPEFTADMRLRLAQGKPVVIVAAAEKPPRISLAVATTRQHVIVLGELNPEYLWGPPDELPAATEFCVIEEGSRALLYCSAPMEPQALDAAQAASRSAFASSTWTREGETYRTVAWSQFLRAALGSPDWVVVASQPERHQLVREIAFRNLYIPVVILALLLVTWLTIRQSRNISEPVAQLANRARGISGNDFDTRLDMKRDDEFGELAGAFDSMSHRLGRQFASLKALSEIDRLILSTEDTAEIVRTVLHRMAEAVLTDAVTITLFDQENRNHARTYFRLAAAKEGVSMLRQEVSAADRDALEGETRSDWISLASPAPLPAYLAHLRELGVSHAYVQPIVWRGVVCGALALAYFADTEATDEERQEVRELADRVAVAVSSAWRDEQLYNQSHFDALTALPNRLLFKDRLEREIARSQRGGLTFALLFIDLDNFKNVNDSYGHTLGDDVLREAARRIAQCVRDTDTVSRLGGDEFTVLLTNLGHPQEAWLLSETIVAALSRQFELGEEQCFLSASVGISSYPVDGTTGEELLKCADTAMYRAKAAGRSQAVFFEERMNAEAVSRLKLDRDLRAAIERGEMVMHYQPQLDLRSGKVVGAEALVRWMHPTQGLISPARFIPLAEESGFIEHLGRWTIEQACNQMKAWRALDIDLERVSVNVSPRQFRKRSTVDFLRSCALEAGLPPSCLEIEITEGLLLDRGAAVEGMLREIAANGHGIALDDFGTGFSSMAYLKRFPVDTIKIDRVFVDGVERSADSQAIVAAIIAMSHALGKKVIAEGVETEEQLALLRKLRCDEIQGFYVSKAVPPAQFEDFLREHLGSVAAE